MVVSSVYPPLQLLLKHRSTIERPKSLICQEQMLHTGAHLHLRMQQHLEGHAVPARGADDAVLL